MAKLIIALLLVATCTLIGYQKSSELRTRVHSLADLINALEVMRSEICTRLTPMPELMRRLSNDSSRETGQFFTLVNSNMGALGQRSFLKFGLIQLKGPKA
jgi:stage III sporulation protein AB